ncbi:MAG: DUF3604 domain-containing protein [Bacillota bacterium]|nr:DUF3604 domain-containing protein [Bacillota bacterium]
MIGTGQAKIDLKQVFAGAHTSFAIEYETGEFGVDDSGEILIARRDVCDSDIPQFENPLAPGYVSVWTDSKAVILKANYIADRYIRPWKSCISIRITDGSLCKGDKVFIRFGNPDGQGMGYRLQTFAEKEHLFRVLVDCAGSGNFYDLEIQPVLEIIGGTAQSLQIVAPSLVVKKESFSLFVRAIDSFGNIAVTCNSSATLWQGSAEIGRVRLTEGIGICNGICLDQEGCFTFICRDDSGFVSGKSNPVKCGREKADHSLFWGDMHGQTKETVGTGTPDLYFAFARDKSHMDFCGWQGNDFQVTDETWQALNASVRKYHEPGRFVTFPGYEWSGTTPVGGDHNIYYLYDDQPIHRSYHWQIDMDQRDGSDRSPISELFKEFAGRDDVMAVPHVGGRYANIDFYDERFIHLMEIHSHHGTFEWFVEEAIARCLKPGILAASDDHTCRPGLSYPTRKTSRGFVSFDVIGGYTGVFADELTRESLWQAFRNRHTYGTTGERIYLNVRCGPYRMGDEFVVQKQPKLQVEVLGTDEILDVEIKRGLDVVARYSDTLARNRNRLRIVWSGVRVKSRAKKVNWNGSLSIRNGKIKNVQNFAFNQPDEMACQLSGQDLKWISSTSGDIDGIEFDLDWQENTFLAFSSQPVSFTVRIQDLINSDQTIAAGGVNQKVCIGFATLDNAEQVNMTFTDPEIKCGVNPYWVKVTQRNGHMAWSSPIYIHYQA